MVSRFNDRVLIFEFLLSFATVMPGMQKCWFNGSCHHLFFPLLFSYGICNSDQIVSEV